MWIDFAQYNTQNHVFNVCFIILDGFKITYKFMFLIRPHKYLQGVAKYRSPPPQQNWAISQRKPLYFWKAYFNTILYAKYQTIWLVGSLPV